MILGLVAVLAIVPAFVLKPSLLGSVDQVVTDTLNKGDSESYKERSESDAGGIDAAMQSYGLGVGWGSYRSSSFIPGVLANAGFFGLVAIVWQVLWLRRMGSRGRRASPVHGGRILVDGFTAAMATELGTALMSEPMISDVTFYLQLGTVAGVLVRMSMPSVARRPFAWAGVRTPFPLAPSLRRDAPALRRDALGAVRSPSSPSE